MNAALRISVSVAVVLTCGACGPHEQPLAPSTPPISPVSSPSIAVSYPRGKGIATVTPFSFTALDFTADPGRSLSYSWDFGDGLAETTSTAPVTHVYQNPGAFSVNVNAVDSNGRMLGTAATQAVVVVLTGSWGIRYPSGQWVVDRGMFLNQNEATLRGDITYLAGCLVVVDGAITSTGSLNLSFTLPTSNGCQPFPIPLPSTFSGTADEDINTFQGQLNGIGPVTISRCLNNTTVVNCE